MKTNWKTILKALNKCNPATGEVIAMAVNDREALIVLKAIVTLVKIHGKPQPEKLGVEGGA